MFISTFLLFLGRRLVNRFQRATCDSREPLRPWHLLILVFLVKSFDTHITAERYAHTYMSCVCVQFSIGFFFLFSFFSLPRLYFRSRVSLGKIWEVLLGIR